MTFACATWPCPPPPEVSLFFPSFSLSDSLDETRGRMVGQLWGGVPGSGAEAGHPAWTPGAWSTPTAVWGQPG